MGGVDIQVIVRVSFEQGFMTFGKLISVFRHIGTINLKQNLILRERIRMVIAGFIACRGLSYTAGPGRNRAGGVAGHFTTHRGEIFSQTGCLFRRNLSLNPGCTEHYGEQQDSQKAYSFSHTFLLENIGKLNFRNCI